MKFKKGNSVTQIIKPITGSIVNVAIVDDEVQYEVAYIGEDGENHSRFFKEGEIDLTPKSTEE